MAKQKVYIFSYLVVLLIGVVDHMVGYEVSSSILYFIPIYVLASHQKSSLRAVLGIAAWCSFAWLIVDQGHVYSGQWILFWNSLVRAITFFAIGIAVYALKNKNENLKEAKRDLQRLNEEKNRYLGIAAHDLRSPMSSIYGLSSLLLNGPDKLTVNQTEFVKLINTISHNSMALLHNLLDVSQIEAGTLLLKPTEQDYVSYVREIIKLNQFIVQSKDQYIRFETQADFLPLSFDSSYLGQVLNNLLSNASKYSYAGSEIKVRISIEGMFVKTEIQDQGLGIRKEDLEKIFRPFQKTRNQPTAGERASGLGLAIVRKIVEAHQGKIGVQSVYGEGSCFCFLLPLQELPIVSQELQHQFVAVEA